MNVSLWAKYTVGKVMELAKICLCNMKFQNATLFSKIFLFNESNKSNGLRSPQRCIFELSLPIKFLLVPTFFRNSFFDTISLKQ